MLDFLAVEPVLVWTRVDGQTLTGSLSGLTNTLNFDPVVTSIADQYTCTATVNVPVVNIVDRAGNNTVDLNVDSEYIHTQTQHVANLYIDSCSDLSLLTNGVINYDNIMGSPRPVNTVATYTCTSSFTLMGNTTRTCGSDGQWSGSAPTCQRESPLITNYLHMYPLSCLP